MKGSCLKQEKNIPRKVENADNCHFLLCFFTLHMTCNMQKGTFGHLRKVLSRISLRYPRRLIRNDTLRQH